MNNQKEQPFTNNHAALYLALDFFGSKKHMSDALELDPSAITHWFNNTNRVSFKNACKIERKTGGLIKASDLMVKYD